MNDLLMSCWTSSRFKFKSTSGSDAGRGSVKALNPWKKFRILSPTFPALSSCDADSDLKTYERIKSNIDPSVGRRFPIFKISKKKRHFLRTNNVFVAGKICLGNLSPII